jgi:hypothetical protein
MSASSHFPVAIALTLSYGVLAWRLAVRAGWIKFPRRAIGSFAERIPEWLQFAAALALACLVLIGLLNAAVSLLANSWSEGKLLLAAAVATALVCVFISLWWDSERGRANPFTIVIFVLWAVATLLGFVTNGKMPW